jgi:endonuclease/exonuclease/phosphatase family metal-dependent hydrolase/2'-5' RNA ligase
MAATGEISSFATSSYETALCVIPPESDCRHVDSLRALYDKNYGKWPPHINLIYPFVAPESLPQVKAQIETILHETPSTPPKHPITLDHAGYFEHRSNSTIFLSGESYDSISILLELRAKILRGLGQDATSNKLHLTIGQSKHETESSAKFLLNKAALLPSLVFAPCTLAILLRERISGSSEAASRMRIWGSIEVFKSTRSSPPLREFWLQDPKDHVNARQVQPGMTYQFDARRKQWRLADSSPKDRASPASLSISSYNLLTDSRFPTTGNRSPELIKVILSQAALADVLVLQEVSDDFLSYLLCNYEIQEQYPFASHGPPSQANIDPLPSLRNVVMLSKWHFDWRFVPFHRPHKGAVVATIPRTIQNGVRQGLPFVVGGVHLKSGLTDGSVAAKKLQLQHLTDHLNREYPAHPWIVAGDFNITTSKYTINEAEKSKSISRQTVRTLESMESTLSGTGFLDAWAVARVEGTASSAKSEAEDLFEGEEGATFNPRENSLAAATSGTWNGRPQRYDRILVRPCGLLSVSRFVEFGLPKTYEDIEQVASDHSGIRASFNVTDTSSESLENSETLFKHPVGYKHALVELSRDGMVAQVLGQRSIFPTTDEEKRRKDAFMLIRKVVLGLSDDGDATPDIPMIMVPVGSYALGVWTIDSDIDCLCIGSISSKVFFQLTRQRIHKAEAQGVRLLRRVDAKTGSMLELSVDGFNVDLQYCPAASVVER